jgi:serine/threonine-protein kinase
MATVYRARDKRLGREVAVKIIHRHLRENTEVGQRFASEARAVAKVKHPGVVEVYDVSDEESDERYLVVELVRGQTLRQLLTKQGHLPPEVAAAIGIEIAQALEHAHSLGVIHRDVKPENVLLRTPAESARSSGEAPERSVKITDFGIAKLLDAQGVTSTGQVLGSPAHMAPEQIEGGEVDARSDVFGLGVLLYECMVGRLPFDGKNPAQVLRRVLEGAFTQAERARPTIGARLGEIVDRALAKDAKLRFASAQELADALRGEVERAGFADTSHEICEYLRDPAKYELEFEKRVVAALLKQGRAAREARDVPLAAASFNRALALCPDDAELISEVSSLARRERARRLVTQLVAAALGSAIIAGGIAGLYELGSKVRAATRSATAQSARTAPAPVRPPPIASAGAPVAGDGPSASATKPARRVPSGKPAPDNVKEPAEAQLARVRVLVNGPQNATVYVDGRPFENWFGTAHDLPVGEHTFEFRPPNSECCVGSVFRTVMIRAPEAQGEEQVVQGVIEWKPAILEFRGAPLSTASCGEVASFAQPGSKVIPMQRATQRARCTVLPAPQSGEAPKAFDVELSPGRTSSFPRP